MYICSVKIRAVLLVIDNCIKVPLKQLVIGIARDLTGAAIAFNNRASYGMLFEWYYPDNIKVLGKALKIWGHDPDVSTPVLKCKFTFLDYFRTMFVFGVAGEGINSM